LAAREREVELLRQRVEEAEKELEGMREELGQAQARIETLLEMGDGDGERSEEGSEEASMAFDKVRRPSGRRSSLSSSHRPTVDRPSSKSKTAEWRDSRNGGRNWDVAD